MNISISKVSISILLLSLPLNFIVLSGGGNIYFSTLILIIQFLTVLTLSQGGLLRNKGVLISMIIFALAILITGINIFLNGLLVNSQITNSVIYIQNFLGLALMFYYIKHISLEFFFKLFIIITLLSIFRIVIEEPNHIFKLSVLRGERIESLFLAGVNTFAVFCGLSLVISFFYIKNKFLRIFLSLFFFLTIILTMSRGALIALIFTLFITSLYDTNRRTFNFLIKYTVVGVMAGILLLVFTGKMEAIIELLQNRFFSVFNKDTTLDSFFAGRFTLIEYVLQVINDSSVFQFFFGHGNGSIDFTIPETGQNFKTTHLVVLDILFRNGLIITILYLCLLGVIMHKFLKYRNRDKIVLFGLFVFFHLELLVNPMIFSAQSGWIYFVFLVLFLNQNRLNMKKTQ